jgi:predicted transcriptional regulator
MKLAFQPIPKEFVSGTEFFDSKSPLTKAIEKVSKYGAVVVLNGKDYFGIVDERSIQAKKNLDIGKRESISKFAKKAPVLDSSTSIDKAIIDFYESGSKALAYREEGKIKGIVHRNSLLKAMLSLHLISDYKVQEIMSTPILAINEDANLSQAKAAMDKNRVKRLIVMSKKGASGILTYKDIMKYLMQSRRRVITPRSSVQPNISVGEASNRNIYTISKDASIDDAIRSFVENKVSSLMVVGDSKPIGVVTVKDVFEVIAKESSSRENRITLSGLDSYTKEYEEDIKENLSALMEKLNRFHKIQTTGVSANVKRLKDKNYEVKLRIFLTERGAVSISTAGYSMERVLNDAINKAYGIIRNRKEIIYMSHKRENVPEEDAE